jgi:hypothetical protein
MRYPSRGPIGSMGIDGKPIAAGRRRDKRTTGDDLTEAAA